MKHILSGAQFNIKDIEKILAEAEKIETDNKSGKVKKLLQDKIIACIFYEPSTRTRLSFESAALRLGASVISSENASINSSAFKGETIEDTTRIIENYADAIVIRHSEAGIPERASKVSSVPIVNAGDGTNQHPSQGLLDLYTIKKEHGHLDNLSIAFVGDILHSRTLYSLMPLLLLYPNNTFYFIAPKELVLTDEYKKYLLDNKVTFQEVNTLDETLPKVDVLYMTRVQKERFQNLSDYEKVKDVFLLKPEHLKLMKKDAIIMHPLPRVNEIDSKIDQDSRAAYFRQAKNGLYVRMALLLYVFTKI
jgi:aspartate carbamoyltransferase catalytic subunit